MTSPAIRLPFVRRRRTKKNAKAAKAVVPPVADGAEPAGGAEPADMPVTAGGPAAPRADFRDTSGLCIKDFAFIESAPVDGFVPIRPDDEAQFSNTLTSGESAESAGSSDETVTHINLEDPSATPGLEHVGQQTRPTGGPGLLGGPDGEPGSGGNPGSEPPTAGNDSAPNTQGKESRPKKWGWFTRIPLSARLVTMISALLAVGLFAAAATSSTVVSNYLTEQVDHDLENTADAIGRFGNFGGGRGGPSEFYVEVRDSAGNNQFNQPWTTGKYGVPNIPDMDSAATYDTTKNPFTVGSTGGSNPAQWRVYAEVMQDAATGDDVLVFVASPLNKIQDTTRFLWRTLAGTSLVIILMGGLVAYALVRRSLRPLREIEATAAAIAAGDLSRRVPPAPPTTEVGSLSLSLNAMLAQIEQAFAIRQASEGRMRRFVSDASHELRTPLATIKGYGELYRMGALDNEDKVNDTMGRIEDAATRMGTLVNDLLSLARLDEGRPMRHEPVDLIPIAKGSAQDLHALDPGREVQFISLTDGEAPARLMTVGDEDRIRQVMTNLVGNIARHTPSGTPVEIAAGEDTEGVILEIRDHGPGLAPEQASRIFERFYRVDTSRNRASGGSGLGMAIVAAIVGAHGGKVWVSPTDGGGLTIRVLLPHASGDGGAPDTKP